MGGMGSQQAHRKARLLHKEVRLRAQQYPRREPHSRLQHMMQSLTVYMVACAWCTQLVSTGSSALVDFNMVKKIHRNTYEVSRMAAFHRHARAPCPCLPTCIMGRRGSQGPTRSPGAFALPIKDVCSAERAIAPHDRDAKSERKAFSSV